MTGRIKITLTACLAELDDNENPEDAIYLFSEAILKAAAGQVRTVAKEHAEKAEYIDGKFDTYDEENAVLFGWRTFCPAIAQHLAQEYEYAFHEVAPEVVTCEECKHEHAEKECPNHQNK